MFNEYSVIHSIKKRFNENLNVQKWQKTRSIILTLHIHPSIEMNMTTPMNCVKRMSGVKKDHTGHSAMLKLQEKQKCYKNIHNLELS